jgi:hypothetical protein
VEGHLEGCKNEICVLLFVLSHLNPLPLEESIRFLCEKHFIVRFHEVSELPLNLCLFYHLDST